MGQQEPAWYIETAVAYTWHGMNNTALYLYKVNMISVNTPVSLVSIELGMWKTEAL